MKAVIMAMSLLTNAIGNLITLGLTAAFKGVFETQVRVKNKLQASSNTDQSLDVALL